LRKIKESELRKWKAKAAVKKVRTEQAPTLPDLNVALELPTEEIPASTSEEKKK
jgi:hypothetical protein